MLSCRNVFLCFYVRVFLLIAPNFPEQVGDDRNILRNQKRFKSLDIRPQPIEICFSIDRIQDIGRGNFVPLIRLPIAVSSLVEKLNLGKYTRGRTVNLSEQLLDQIFVRELVLA